MSKHAPKQKKPVYVTSKMIMRDPKLRKELAAMANRPVYAQDQHDTTPQNRTSGS
jgi:hypothetical protein